MPPGATVELEELVLEAGADPFQLLDDYAERVARRYDLKDLPAPFANWCSWYPYRLGVDEAKVLATAAAAKARHLDRLGLRFIQVDLGWEKHNIPTYFEENERFPHGLRWLATRLEEYGFELGVWKGFACVSENHELAREHPEWLVHKDDGSLADCGTWFWEPHDRIYVLDITHPGAQEWVSRNIASLAARGVRYLKWDFGGCLNVGGRRHDPAIACAGALEGMRLASGLVNEAFGDGLVLDCTATETANLGHFKMIYTNWDTGNTGIGIRHLRWTTTTAATHLFKNRRWALLQPSCLVVGLPGATEEARIRATVTFLFGGHTDISDTLAALPEERWRILLATLPPLPTRARAADLFHPLAISQGSDVALCQGKALPPATTCDPQGALVWHAPVRTDWDEWELVALFHLFERVVNGASQALSLRFQLPFTALGLDPARTFWAYEFWNEQALGTIPVPARPQGCYRHPGDYAALINDGRPGWLDLTCHGPAVKLLVLRRPRPHPWPLSTTFHLSGGLELSGVQWQPATRTLSGCLQRPPGEQGRIIIGGVAADQAVEAGVGDAVVPVGRLPNAAVSLPVLTQSWETPWSLRLG